MIAHALEGSDVRTEKVAALQQAIASGSYQRLFVGCGGQDDRVVCWSRDGDRSGGGRMLDETIDALAALDLDKLCGA